MIFFTNRYIFHLLSDGRIVNDIQLTKAGSSVITSCVLKFIHSLASIFPFFSSFSHDFFLGFIDRDQLTVLSDDDAQLLFLGSRVGDSLLLQYTAAADDKAPQQNGIC
jgi:hypothetical protein